MIKSIRYTDAEETMGIIEMEDIYYSTMLPPQDGYLQGIYEAWIAEGKSPESYVPASVPVPRSVAMWRARTIMKVARWEDGTLFAAVQAAIAGLTDPLQKATAEEALERGDIFDRDGVFVPMLAGVVGISDEQLDDLMEQAAGLPA